MSFLHVADVFAILDKKITHLNTGNLSQWIMLLFSVKLMQIENNMCVSAIIQVEEIIFCCWQVYATDNCTQQ